MSLATIGKRLLRAAVIAGRRALFGVVAFCAAGWAGALMAQEVLSGPTEFYEKMTELPGTLSTGTSPLKVGPVDFHPHLTYLFTDGTGILSSPGQSQDTIINSISPGVLMNLGTHWALDYTSTLTFYSSRYFRDTLGEAVNLTGHTTYEDWSFQLSQNYSDSTLPYIETGAQTEIITYVTSASAARQLGSKMSLSMSGSQSINSAPGYVNYDAWAGSVALNYQFWPGLSAGINAGGGYDTVSTGSALAFETVGAQFNWLVQQKLAVQLSGGLEDSQFLAFGRSVIGPVFSAGIQYHPFESTSFGLVASRTESPSLFEDQIIETTRVSATLRQRLFEKFFFVASAGYSILPFQGVEFASSPYTLHPPTAPSVVAIGTTRQDTTRFWRVGLSFPFLRRGEASIFYAVNNNTSDVSGFSYSSRQFGLDLTCRF